MAVSVKKRSITTKNILGFIIFSFLYTYVIYSISLGETAVDLNKLIGFINVNQLQLTLGILSFIWVYFFWKYMDFVFVAYCIVSNINVFTYFSNSFDKLVLVFNFFFLIVSYMFYLLLKSEKGESVYDPRFKKYFLGNKSEYKIPCHVSHGEKKYQGYLTNWDSDSIFVYIDSKERVSLSGRVDLEFEFGRNKFNNNGIVRTMYGNGYGITLKKSDDDFNWKKLYNVLSDRGYKPRYS